MVFSTENCTIRTLNPVALSRGLQCIAKNGSLVTGRHLWHLEYVSSFSIDFGFLTDQRIAMPPRVKGKLSLQCQHVSSLFGESVQKQIVLGLSLRWAKQKDWFVAWASVKFVGFPSLQAGQHTLILLVALNAVLLSTFIVCLIGSKRRNCMLTPSLRTRNFWRKFVSRVCIWV